MKLISSDFNPKTGISTVKISTRDGIFTGTAMLNPEDKDIASNFAGCHYAEMRAYIKYYHSREKHIKIKIEGLRNYEKCLKNRKDYNPHSVENRQLRKYIIILEQEQKSWHDKQISLENYITDCIQKREWQLKVIAERKNRKEKEES